MAESPVATDEDHIMAEALQMCCAGQVMHRATASRLLQQHLPRRTEAGRINETRATQAGARQNN